MGLCKVCNGNGSRECGFVSIARNDIAILSCQDPAVVSLHDSVCACWLPVTSPERLNFPRQLYLAFAFMAALLATAYVLSEIISRAMLMGGSVTGASVQHSTLNARCMPAYLQHCYHEGKGPRGEYQATLSRGAQPASRLISRFHT